MDDGGFSTASNDDASNRGDGVDPPSTTSPGSVPSGAGDDPRWPTRAPTDPPGGPATTGAPVGRLAGERAPYPGLTAFRTQDAAWFFGRDALVSRLLADLAERLTTGKPLVLVGDPGAGKSSLLAAGLLPAVAEGGLPVAGSHEWPWLTMTPGRTPLEELVTRAATLAGVSATQAIAEIRAEPTAFGALAAQAAAMIGSAAHRRGLDGGRLLIVVDQLEELFTQCTDSVERESFITALTSADPALVVMAVRADFYPDCLRLDRLAAVFAAGHVPMPAMRTDELRSVITEPAALAGVTPEPGLVELLTAELHDHGLRPVPTPLPLLAHALRVTWLHGGGHRMTVADYAATGGIDGAVADTAEEIHRSLDDAGRSTLRTAMVSLTDGDRPVRRRAPRAEIPGWLLDRLIGARLVTASGSSVELAHEVLLSAWPRLGDWIRRDRAGLVIRRQLGESIRFWSDSGEDSVALYQAGRLVTALEWAADRRDLSDAERRFLAASVAAEEHERHVRLREVRRLRTLVGGLAVLLVAVLTAGAIMWGQRA
ncbi:ATP-binding protein [Actinoalloteichus hymeniacidonis]|uniref:AAA ATPase domain n=1 Tax=Actinoalloteichus hymeniacidonis TaxID=340345 RepID=A0AAC9HMS6_9PSEU|nr:ATP-binding protein [Actinoalloteichus hymeniacidonis]AOS62232.1 AAA ATPase domain [Actinoalloteichus hymeniacidonis]MBB5909742.1 energy-coupling factor transporter ATP-binding protein EcfA2 [Actinoalloteichus hymeniacidonis]